VLSWRRTALSPRRARKAKPNHQVVRHKGIKPTVYSLLSSCGGSESPETFACRIRVARCGVDYAVGGRSPGIVANFPAGPAIQSAGKRRVASAEEEVGGARGEGT